MFTKWRYSAFHRSGLAEFLRDGMRDQVVVCGVYVHVGVMMTACDAFTRDFESVADAIADFTPDYHRLAITWTAERCSVVAGTQTVLGWLEGGELGDTAAHARDAARRDGAPPAPTE